jgi:hypothetical protein
MTFQVERFTIAAKPFLGSLSSSLFGNDPASSPEEVFLLYQGYGRNKNGNTNEDTNLNMRNHIKDINGLVI